MQNKKNSKPNTEERKRQLLDVALEQFALNGYHKTKVSDVVREADVSQGTFYWYFQSKEEAALDVINEGKQKVLAVIEQGYRREEAAVEEMAASTTNLFYDLFTFADDNRHLMILLFIKGYGADLAIRKAVAETYKAIEEAFRRNLERAMELELLPKQTEPEVQAALITNMITGTISRWLFGPNLDINYQSHITAEKMARYAAEFEFYGIAGAWSKGEKKG
ncbi:TetR/AcrR family transcriptional regulator [Salibacterium aidingense]|uniref:TetR/AcrR family transcriptional regulator n=1 Tax=Salibacterium aidingense TaxID=384933 RepID=UPI000401BA3C|nr:TetR/AcrR family transcriptional regulator [Salibacterium aidingense]